MSEGTSLHPARPTVYKGIQMRSRLEAGYAAWLDRWGFDWAYEPCAFAHPELGQYLPDFLLRSVHTPWPNLAVINLYVEVKPFKPEWDDPAVARLARIVMANEPHNSLAFAYPTEQGHVEMLFVLCDEFYGWFKKRQLGPATADFDTGLYYGVEVTWEDAEYVGATAPLAIIEPGLRPDQGPWYREWWKGID